MSEVSRIRGNLSNQGTLQKLIMDQFELYDLRDSEGIGSEIGGENWWRSSSYMQHPTVKEQKTLQICLLQLHVFNTRCSQNSYIEQSFLAAAMPSAFSTGIFDYKYIIK